jgi:hypothetical protein
VSLSDAATPGKLGAVGSQGSVFGCFLGLSSAFVLSFLILDLLFWMQLEALITSVICIWQVNSVLTFDFGRIRLGGGSLHCGLLGLDFNSDFVTAPVFKKLLKRVERKRLVLNEDLSGVEKRGRNFIENVFTK